MSGEIANTYRFFVPPQALQGDTVELADADLARQMGRVLRLRAGDRVLLLDGLGTACVVTLLDLGRGQVRGRIEQRKAATGEPAIALTLYVGIIRPERFEWMLQKGTELGASGFVPVQMSRSTAAEQATGRKLERWQKIIREAAEQSCRGKLPTLAAPLSFAQACEQAAASDLALLLWEGAPGEEPARSLRAVLRAPRPAPPATIAVLSGPEGGISPEELTSASGHGIIPVSLGPRILRAETAPVAAATAIFYELDAPGENTHTQ